MHSSILVIKINLELKTVELSKEILRTATMALTHYYSSMLMQKWKKNNK